MNDDKIKITINIESDLHERIREAIAFRNLENKFIGRIEETNTVEEFIVGAIIDTLDYLDIFKLPIKESKLKNQNFTPLKNNLKSYLKERGIKQYEFAEAIGIETASLNGICNNRMQPTLDTFFRIWSTLGYPPIDELFYRES